MKVSIEKYFDEYSMIRRENDTTVAINDLYIRKDRSEKETVIKNNFDIDNVVLAMG